MLYSEDDLELKFYFIIYGTFELMRKQPDTGEIIQPAKALAQLLNSIQDVDEDVPPTTAD